MYSPTEIVTDGDETSAVDVYALVDVDVETTSAEDLSSNASVADAEFSEESTSETEEQDERHARIQSAWETDVYGSEVMPATLSAYVEVEPADDDEPMASADVDARTDGVEPSSYYVEVDDSDDGVAPKNENEVSKERSESGNATECRSSWMEAEVYEQQSAYEEPSNYQELDVAPVPMAKDAPSNKKTKEKKTKGKTSPIRPSPPSSVLSTSPSLPLGAYAIPIPPPPPPPLLHLSLSDSSSSRAAVAEEENTNDNIYHYMKKQQKTKGSVIIQPQGQRPLATQHGTTTLIVNCFVLSMCMLMCLLVSMISRRVCLKTCARWRNQ
jgi:hypothetical protein